MVQVIDRRKDSGVSCNRPEPRLSSATDVLIKVTGAVVEAVGPLLPLALELVHAGGKILQFGHDVNFHKLPGIIESGILPLGKIVSHRLALSRVHEGLDLLRKGQAIKVILHPED